MTKITHDVEAWTPAMAKKALTNNTVNRGLRPKRVSSFREEMESGLWQMTGEPIKFSADGQLLDGQHRLTALANAAVESIQLMVVRGLAPESQIVMDSGSARTAADALGFIHQGLKNKTAVASIARWLTIAPVPRSSLLSDLKGGASNGAIVQTFGEDPEAISLAAANALKLSRELNISAASIGYCWYLCAKVDAEDANEFFNSLITLSWPSDGDPRKAAYLRLRSIAIKSDAKAANQTSVMIISVLTRAWNDWRAGKKIYSYKSSSNTRLISPVVPR